MSDPIPTTREVAGVLGASLDGRPDDPMRRRVLESCAGLVAVALCAGRAEAAAKGDDLQPLLAQVRRLVDAMAHLGEPFGAAELQAFQTAESAGNPAASEAAIDALLMPRCLLDVRINPESRVSVARGPAPGRLVEQGWRAFVVKVRNEAGVTGRLTVESPQARPVYRPATNNAMAPPSVRPADIADRWLELQSYDEKPMEPQLSGLEVEYRIVLLYSRDRGRREAQIGASVSPGTEDIGFRNRVAIVFTAAASHELTFRIRDEHGRPAIASLLVQDTLGRVYPARSKRLAPDFFFQRQVYRGDGEHLRLPAGSYSLVAGRGPEYRPQTRTIERSGGRAAFADRDRPDPLDRCRVPGVVLGRPSRPRRRLQPLREPDRRRAARGHDAPRRGRGARASARC